MRIFFAFILFCRNQSRSLSELPILQSIFEAILSNEDTAQAQLGSELIEKLGDFATGRETENPRFNSTLQSYFDKCKNILKF